VRHRRTGRKLGRDPAHRKALFSNMAGSLFEHGRIRTTEAKAKELRPVAEKLITLARADPGDVAAQRQAVAYLRSKEAVYRLFHEVAPRFTERPGGYTRIVKLGPRRSDSTEMVFLELV
jgi:large subunit ribosomal protein L17